MLFFVTISALFVAVSARTQLTNCLDDDKYCVGLPRGCLGPECFVAFSSKSNGTHAEVEIFGNDILDKTWLGIAYSADKEMKDDIVLFCIRDDKLPDQDDVKQMAGIAYNTDHLNQKIGTIREIANGQGKDRFKLGLDIQEYDKADKTLYCKMTHRIEPLTSHFNMTKLEILMAKGVWIRGNLSYHGKTRNSVGQVDISGEKKKKKNSSTTSLALLSAAITFLAARIL